MISVRLYTILFLSGLLTLQSFAQSLVLPSLPPPRHTYSIGMQQEFNTYLWNTGIEYSKMLDSGVGIHITEAFRSSMLQSGSNQNKWKDDQTLKMRLFCDLGSNLSLVSDFTSVIFLDNQSGFSNDVRTHHGSMGIVYDSGSHIRGYISAGDRKSVV